MRVERPIKYRVLERNHSHPYGEVTKLSETLYFAEERLIPKDRVRQYSKGANLERGRDAVRNRFSNE